VVSFTLRLIYLRGNSPYYQLYRRLSGFQRWCGHSRGKKKISMQGNEPQPSSLYRVNLNEYFLFVIVSFGITRISLSLSLSHANRTVFKPE
jgi:hypothetical protein